METEYATLVADPQQLDPDDLPPSYLVYDQICEAIRRDQPTVPGLYDRDQMFLASGGAVTFESHPLFHDLPGGLVEVATPEVRSPLELLACQRSIDDLVAQASADSETGFDLRVLKNSSDAMGHVYGCHENYEARVAQGVWLPVYWCCMALLWFMQVMTLLVSLPVMGALTLFVRRTQKSDSDRSDEPRSIFEPESESESEDRSSHPSEVLRRLPSGVAPLLITFLRIVHLPTVIVLKGVARHVAFRRQRRFLTPFLISRPALCGSGYLDHEGRYQMSAKAMAIDAIADMGGFRGERPIYVFGHWLGQFCTKSFLSLASTRQMFRRHQRLQIGLSDSNLSDLAQYVKVGSVSLLLDMIEDGATDDLPTIRHPLASLRRLASDWNLIARVPTSRGELSAIELQKIYLNAAQKYVDSTAANLRGEAPAVLQRWGELLDHVVAFRKNALDIDGAIGRVDWLTKRFLMDRAGAASSAWTSRKKIDLRYHELSAHGYYFQLVHGRSDLPLVDEQHVARRRRSPPPGSPAARRAWLIREFADSEPLVHVDWNHGLIGKGRNRRRVEFTQAR